MNILQEFYNDQVLNTGHKYSESGIYIQIDPDNDYNGYMNYIKSLPINDNPEIFGLHNNANITSAQNETIAMFEALLLLQPKTAASGGKSREEVFKLVPQLKYASNDYIYYNQGTRSGGILNMICCHSNQ